jgi:hypothetical protein
MNDWLKKRLSEPTTYAGLAAIVMGAGQLGKVNEAPAVADAIVAAAPHLAAGNWLNALMIGLGSLAVLMKEKGGK